MRLACSLIFAALPIIVSSTLTAQEKRTAPAPRTFLGASECVKCHFSGLPKAEDANSAALEVLGFTGLVSDSWVLLDELKTWRIKTNTRRLSRRCSTSDRSAWASCWAWRKSIATSGA